MEYLSKESLELTKKILKRQKILLMPPMPGEEQIYTEPWNVPLLCL